MRIISWNIAGRDEPWRDLAAGGVDVALLQEAKPPPADVAARVDDRPWATAGTSNRPWRTVVAGLSDRVHVRHLPARAIGDAGVGDLHVSREGTLAVAEVEDVRTGETLTVASIYAAWEGPVSSAHGKWIYADASAHRLISDLSALIGAQRVEGLLVAGDLNIYRGYGEHGSRYWAKRYATVFDRFEALGLCYVGPQAPNGRQASPAPAEMPAGSRNVPTFHTRRMTPATAQHQLDFVFASEDLVPRLSVRAVNGVEEWGPSDHCRVAIHVEPRSR